MWFGTIHFFCCDCHANMIQKNIRARCCASDCSKPHESAPFCYSCFARRANLSENSSFTNVSFTLPRKKKIAPQNGGDDDNQISYLQAIRLSNHEFAAFCNNCIEEESFFVSLLSDHLKTNLLNDFTLERLLCERELGNPRAITTIQNALSSAPKTVGLKVCF